MKAIYSRLMGGSDAPGDGADDGGSCDNLSAEDTLYIEEIIAGVEQSCDKLDELITQYAIDWPNARIARVDLCILRIAIYEMLYREDVPVGAAIDEAVELAKRYGGDRSYAFVNGILGSLARASSAESS